MQMRKGFVLVAGIAGSFCAMMLPTQVLAAPARGVETLLPPDAGAVAAEVDQSRTWQPSSAANDVHIEVHPPKGRDASLKIRVDAISFTGLEGGVAADALAPVVAPFLHQEQTIGGLWDIAAHVTEELHRRGFLAAIAILPEQEVVDGHVTLHVILGHYGKIGLENRSGLTTSRAVGFVHRLVPGELIRAKPLNRTLRILNEIAGLRAHAYLSPGEAAGTADLLLKLERTERQGGAVYLDDYGSRYTGRWRTGVTYHRDQVTHVGDVFSMNVLHGAGDGLDSYDVRYELPLGRDGMRLDAELYRTDYDLMRQYSKYDAYGTASGWRVSLRSPIVRSLRYDLDALCELGTQKTTDRMGVFAVDAEKHDETLRFGFDSTWRTSQSAATLKLLHTFGRQRWDNDDARSGAEANGTAAHFQKTTLDAYAVTRLSPVWTIHATLQAQMAFDNLDSSEKFYIGGYHGVRAFPQGEAGGDAGVLGSVEARAPLGGAWQAAVFYDAGWVRYVHHPIATTDENARTLAGAGFGILYDGTQHLSARLDYAMPLSERWSESMGQNTHGMWWLELADRF